MHNKDAYTRSTSRYDGTQYEEITLVRHDVCLWHISQCAILTAGIFRTMGGLWCLHGIGECGVTQKFSWKVAASLLWA